MFACTRDWSQLLPGSDVDGKGSNGDAFTAHGLPTVLLCSKASQPHRQRQQTPSRSGRGARGAVEFPVSCREISCPVFHGCLHALGLDLQPGCPCQSLPCHCHCSCKEATMEQGYWNRTAPLPSSPLPKDLSAAPAQQTHPGLPTTCSYEISRYSVV